VRGKKMNKRIKILREKLKINQKHFAMRLGLTPSNLSSFEHKKSNLSNQTIALICHEFNVNETWLRTGEGEMFSKNEFSEDEKGKFLLNNFEQLNENFQDYVIKQLENLLNLQEKTKNTS
jgi:transcriptional regulator with XRE-family HTH domain